MLKVKIAARYAKGEVYLKFGHYASGEIALQLLRPVTHEPIATASVSVGIDPLEDFDRHLWLKGWSENEGIPSALVDAGVVTLTGITHPTGFVEAQLARLTDIAFAELQKQLKGEAPDEQSSLIGPRPPLKDVDWELIIPQWRRPLFLYVCFGWKLTADLLPPPLLDLLEGRSPIGSIMSSVWEHSIFPHLPSGCFGSPAAVASWTGLGERLSEVRVPRILEEETAEGGTAEGGAA